MADTVTPRVRSQIMARVRTINTAPELTLQSILRSLGIRFRTHLAHIAGSPDLVFSRRRRVIFVHGCFWHGHHCARGARVPKTNAEYWLEKIDRNRRRDRATLRELRKAGWWVLTVWECQLKGSVRARLIARLRHFFDDERRRQLLDAETTHRVR